MSILKKLSCFYLVTLFTSSAFSNECIDQINDRKIQSGLFFQECKLEDKDVKTIVNFVNNNPDIESLFLSHNNLTDLGIEQLSLLTNKLTAIELENNKIQGKTLSTLRNLDVEIVLIHDNPIDSSAVNNLLLNNHITGLWIGSNKLDDKIVNSVTNREFEILGIEGNSISSNTWKQIAEFARAKSLLINGNKEKINDEVAEKIAKNAYIEILFLKDNSISSYGFTSIFNNPHIHGFESSVLNDSSEFVEPLANSPYVKSLMINPESDIILSGSIGKILSTSKSLDTLLFLPDASHKFSLDADFADSISKSSVENLSVYSYKINDAAAIKLAQSERLKFLDIGSGQISNDGAIALSSNQSLINLTLCDNNISDDGALAFINNNTLESLDLSMNPISQTAANTLKANSKIKNIIVDRVKNRTYFLNNFKVKHNTRLFI